MTQLSPATTTLLQCMNTAYTRVRLRREEDPRAMPSPADLLAQVERDIVSSQASIMRIADEAGGQTGARLDATLRRIGRLETHVEQLVELRWKLRGRS